MDDRQMREQMEKVNAAAEKFAEAIMESYKTVSGRSIEAQERGAELTRKFFESVMQELQSQAEGTRSTTEALLEQSQRQREALQELSQESISAYMNFLNSMFSYYQNAFEDMQRRSGR
ncbi:hypothetical protein [Rubrobacter calidifluminis]|uniref:hypothetical protein n=1 Tax=Rubrobacter calidifluminis TaxID=1392640 RepID=UPI0023616C42|nr:hypothetical protein [Rubrobacter calidifluminis]